jgi:hypothetical protein
MSELDYAIEPEVECSDNDSNDVAFIQATATIDSRVAVEEYVVCKLYPLAVGFGFESVPLRTIPVLRVETPLPLFAVGNVNAEHTNHVLTEAEKVLGSFEPKEHDAHRLVNIPNDGRLNRGLEQLGVPYAPRPLPGSEASKEAIKKWMTEVSKKPITKRAKAGSS